MVTSIINSIIGSNAQKQGASQMAEGQNAAAQTERDQYAQTRGDLLGNQTKTDANYSPYMQTGTSANNQLGYLLGLGGTGTGTAGSLAQPFTMADYQADPGYAFRLQQGQQALDRASSAGGKYFSGQAIKGLTDYNQNSASQEYQNAYDRYNTNQNNLYSRLSGLATTGLNATNSDTSAGLTTQTQLNNAGQNTANQVGADITGAANAHAQGTVGSGQAWVNGLNQTQNDAFKLAGLGGFGGAASAPLQGNGAAVPNGQMVWNGGSSW